MKQDDAKQLQQAGYTDTHIQILSRLPEAILKQFIEDLEVFKKTKRPPETFIFFLKEIATIKDLPKDFRLTDIINKNYNEPYKVFFNSLKNEDYPKKYIQELESLPFHFVIILLRKYDLFVDARFSFSELLLSFFGTILLNRSDLLKAENQLLQLIQQLEKDPTCKAEHIRSTLTNCLTPACRPTNQAKIWLNDLVTSIIKNNISYEILWLLSKKFPVKYFLYSSNYHLESSKISALFNYLTPLRTILHLDDANIFTIVSLNAGAKRLEQVASAIKLLKQYELPQQQIIDLFVGHQNDTFFEGPVLATRLLLTIPEEHSPSVDTIKKDTDKRLNIFLSSDPFPQKKKTAYDLTFFSQIGVSEKPTKYDTNWHYSYYSGAS